MTLLLGFNTVGTDGNDFEVGSNGPMLGSIFTAVASGTIDTITIRTNSTNTCNSIQAGIFSDNAGTPNARIGNVVTIPLTTGVTAYQTSPGGVGAPVVSGTKYWIVIHSQTAANIVFSLHDSTTASGTKDTGSGQTGVAATWPSTLGTFTELMNAHADDASTAAPVFLTHRIPLGI